LYLAGSLADPSTNLKTDALLVQLDANTGNIGNNAFQVNASFAAVTTELGSGNVYVAGSVGDPGHANRRDVALAQYSGDLNTQVYFKGLALTDLGPDTSSAVLTGGGVSQGDGGRDTGSALIVDGDGNAYFAGILGHPNTDVQAVFGRVNATATELAWGFRVENMTPGSGGIGTALSFDSWGNVVFTGSVNDNTGTMLSQDLLLGRAERTTGD